MTNLIDIDNSASMGKLEELRAILKAKIGRKEITQTKIAQGSGVDGASISRFLKEKDGLSLDSFFKVAEHIGAKFFWPHECPPVSSGHSSEEGDLRKKNDELRKENSELTKENIILLRKVVSLYEADKQTTGETITPSSPTFSTSQEQPGDNGG